MEYIGNLNAIDRAFYLLYLEKKDKLLSEVQKWGMDKAVKALKKLGDVVDNKDYTKLGEFVEEKIKDSRLDKF